MGTVCFTDRRLHLTPLAGCLATALAFVSGSATAIGRPLHAPPGAAAMLDRVRNGDLSDFPAGWEKPDPADVALRWQPLPRAQPEVPAGSIVVQNCNDSGAGSLRDALANANNGDTIDLTQLSCSTITLTTGSILFTQTSVTLQGPGSKYLAISGNDQYAPLLHDGLGTLYINGLTVEHGSKYFTDAQIDDARGGCIFSGGSVFLSDSVVAYCTAKNTSTSYRAIGGAIYAQSGVTLSNSSVIDSSAISTVGGAGGGIFTPGFVAISDSFVAGNYARDHGGGVYTLNLTVKYSTIENNTTFGAGGGLYSIGNASITNSTIAGNSASLGGGLVMNALNATAPATLLSSTVSGNMAGKVGGAWVGDYAAVRVANSTIAFNYESNASKYGAGLFLYGPVDVESTIVANNSYSGTAPDDLGGNATAEFGGANNLVGVPLIPAPGDTIELESPRLAPLAFNGGSTATHRLLSGSPAINAGNNQANVSFDQRGSGFPRIIGSGPDIGAFELDTNDVIFADGFDP